MQIHGFAKTTLLDYPKHVAATVFTGSCNFRCPFCHNGDLVLHPELIPAISQEDILAYLTKRQGILEGVCITGGEPTLQKDLPDFIRRIRSLGFEIKLDTNGYRPEILASLIQDHLLDYVAMDIKNTPEKYPMTCGIPDLDISRINQSVSILQEGELPFEFRTTLVRELHRLDDMTIIGEWLKDAPVYFLQNYKESEQVISPGFHPYTRDELQGFRKALLPFIPVVELRGID